MMKKHWKFTKHFAERFVDRFNGDKNSVREISNYFNENVLQCVFDCHVKGRNQRVRIGKYRVCYAWDADIEQIIVTTVY